MGLGGSVYYVGKGWDRKVGMGVEGEGSMWSFSATRKWLYFEHTFFILM